MLVTVEGTVTVVNPASENILDPIKVNPEMKSTELSLVQSLKALSPIDIIIITIIIIIMIIN